MKITSISVQTRDKNRVNVSVDGKYRFSLDVCQLSDLKIKIGQDYSESELMVIEQESMFGKLYSRALEYCLMRPHSAREIRDYLYRKTRPTRNKNGELRAGISPEITERVFSRLLEKKYVDDSKFTHYWVENRSVKKGISKRKLFTELRVKGVDNLIIDSELSLTDRNDNLEIQKIISKKRSHYPDDQKLIAYLARLGFDYDDIKSAINK